MNKNSVIIIRGGTLYQCASKKKSATTKDVCDTNIQTQDAKLANV